MTMKFYLFICSSKHQTIDNELIFVFHHHQHEHVLLCRFCSRPRRMTVTKYEWLICDVCASGFHECKWLSEWHFCVWQATDIGKNVNSWQPSINVALFALSLIPCRKDQQLSTSSFSSARESRFKAINSLGIAVLWINLAPFELASAPTKHLTAISKTVQTPEMQLIRLDFLIDMSLFYFTEMIFMTAEKNPSPSVNQTTMKWKKKPTVWKVFFPYKLKRRRWFILVFVLFSFRHFSAHSQKYQKGLI